MGGLRKFMPLTFGTFAASTLAIIGFPLTSGFFSKDEILARVLVQSPGSHEQATGKAAHLAPWVAPSWMPWLLWTMAVLAATLTAFYMCRALFMTFFGDFRGWTIGRPSQVLKSASHDDHHDDDEHHHEEDLSIPGPPPAESPRAITIPLLVLGTAAIVAGLFNPGMFSLFAEHFDFLPMEHWLAPVFEEAGKGVVELGDKHAMHSREWISTGAAFTAFAVGSYVAYWMYVAQKSKHEASYLVRATTLTSGFSGVIFMIVGGVLLALDMKSGLTLSGLIVPVALLGGGAYVAFTCSKERLIGLDSVYERSVFVAVDALADTSASVDQGVVDFVIARLTSLLVAALGTLLRVLQNGVVHVYAAMMVVGLTALGWFFVQPHADVTVVESGNGDFSVTAGPGSGYQYRWSPDAKGAPQTPSFTSVDSLKVHLEEGESKTVKVEVRNSFSNALEVPVVRWLLSPVAVREIPMTRPKVDKPMKLELGER
jgi:NADH-quinone oxidoreductase subunit L